MFYYAEIYFNKETFRAYLAQRDVKQHGLLVIHTGVTRTEDIHFANLGMNGDNIIRVLRITFIWLRIGISNKILLIR
jgi:hypothetical protein